MNCVQLIGRLTHDPESDRVADGTPVAIFRLAVDRPRRDSADVITVKTWDRTAEAVAKHLVRGRRVAVQGRLFQDGWTGSDGQRASRLIVVAHRVDFLDPPIATGDRGLEETVPPGGAARA